jgi:dihydroorotase-like cyclic amidohydrolase
MAQFDTVIKGGIVVDGTGRGRRRADIGIKDGLIAEIGRIPDHEADEVLDASGMIVAPGFIDLHTHYDAQLFWDPYCTLSGGTASRPSSSATVASASLLCSPTSASAQCSRWSAPKPSRWPR